MRRYETIVIIQPGSSEDEITAVIDKGKEIIESRGGSIVQIDKWGLKRLAYLIRKEPQGYYVYVEYAGIPEAVDELERVYRIDDRVLKYMTVKIQDVYVADEIVETEEEGEEETAEVAVAATEETAEVAATATEETTTTEEAPTAEAAE